MSWVGILRRLRFKGFMREEGALDDIGLWLDSKLNVDNNVEKELPLLLHSKRRLGAGRHTLCFIPPLKHPLLRF